MKIRIYECEYCKVRCDKDNILEHMIVEHPNKEWKANEV